MESVPIDWMAELPGTLITAAHATIMPAKERGFNNIREFGAGFLFVIKAWKQAHSWLRNCFYNTEDGQKD